MTATQTGFPAQPQGAPRIPLHQVSGRLPTRQRRPALIAVAVLLIVSGALGGLQLLTASGHTVSVLVLVRPVPAGHVIESADLRTTALSGKVAYTPGSAEANCRRQDGGPGPVRGAALDAVDDGDRLSARCDAGAGRIAFERCPGAVGRACRRQHGCAGRGAIGQRGRRGHGAAGERAERPHRRAPQVVWRLRISCWPPARYTRSRPTRRRLAVR